MAPQMDEPTSQEAGILKITFCVESQPTAVKFAAPLSSRCLLRSNRSIYFTLAGFKADFNCLSKKLVSQTRLGVVKRRVKKIRRVLRGGLVTVRGRSILVRPYDLIARFRIPH